jgi:hypothetical protein
LRTDAGDPATGGTELAKGEIGGQVLTGVRRPSYKCYAAAMKRTTILLPDELHEQLRREAFQAKTSMAELIRARLRSGAHPRRNRQWARDPILKVAGVCRGPVLSDETDESLYGR